MEDEPTQRMVVSSQLEKSGFTVFEASNGSEGIDKWRDHPDIRVVITDLVMPVMDGFDVIQTIRREETRYTYIIVLSGLEDRTSLVKALEYGADDYLTKPVYPDELNLRLKNAGRLIRLEGLDDLVFGMAELTGYRSGETGLHLRRVQEYCQILAEHLLAQQPELNLSRAMVKDIVTASPLHDIGKVSIPDSILHKPGRLTPEEFEKIKPHSTIGGKLLWNLFQKNKSNFLKLAHDITLCHHEKWDGSGYPGALRGKEIPLAARIVALADVYDALTSERCYKNPLSPEEAKSIIRAENGKHFDPVMVESFLACEKKWVEVQDKLRDPLPVG